LLNGALFALNLFNIIQMFWPLFPLFGEGLFLFIICLQINLQKGIDKLLEMWYNIYRKKERGSQ
jgi:hypothetical protein